MQFHFTFKVIANIPDHKNGNILAFFNCTQDAENRNGKTNLVALVPFGN